jgi:hypothetical protein
MKKTFLLLALAAGLLMTAAPALADGGFYVVAVGRGVGTKITSLPMEINTPGFYYLTGNLSYSGASNGITINSDDVTIDLMGFSLSGPGSSGSSYGIIMNNTGGYRRNVEVRNGTISGWNTAVDSILGDFNQRALNLRVVNCINGIMFRGYNGQIKGCTVFTTGSGTGITNGTGVTTGNTVSHCVYGIVGAGTISGNSVGDCTLYHISVTFGASSIIGNTIFTTGQFQTGIYISSSDPVLVTQNSVGGPGTPFHAGSKTVNVANTNAGF